MEDIVENFLIEKLNDLITKAKDNENKASNCKLFLVHEEFNKLKELIEESTANTGAALKHTRREKLYYLLNVMAEWLQLLERPQFLTPVAVARADGRLKQIEKDLKEPLESQEVLRARLQKIEKDLKEAPERQEVLRARLQKIEKDLKEALERLRARQGPLKGEDLEELRGRLKQSEKDLKEPLESQGVLRARLQEIAKDLKEPLESQGVLRARLQKFEKDLQGALKDEVLEELRRGLKQIEKDLTEPVKGESQGEGGSQQLPKEVTAEDLRARLQKIKKHLKVKEPLKGDQEELLGILKQIEKDLTEPLKGESQRGGGSQQPPNVTAEDLRARLKKIEKDLKEPRKGDSEEELLGRLKQIEKDLKEPLKGDIQEELLGRLKQIEKDVKEPHKGDYSREELLERLTKIKKDLTEPFKGERQDQIYRWSSHAVDIDKIHGFKDKGMIMKRLLLKEGHKVISIVGVAGVGKTALCQVAFNEEEVRKHFPLRIWLCLSRQQNLHAGNHAEEFLVKRALSCLGFDDDVIERIGQGGVHKLKAALQQQLRREYLIVLDDVWKIEEGDKLEEGDDEMGKAIQNLFSFFIQDGGTVIVTSRSGKLEETVVRPPKKLHRLKLLPLADDDSCWTIFSDAVNRAGFDGLDWRKKEILINCQGLPLMAKMLGQISHLQLKTLETEVKN